METAINSGERISRLRKRFLKQTPYISAERAFYYTQSWKETENSGLALNVRVAMAMKNVYENMRFHVDPDDRIAGTWTENFLGVPIEPERGLFNRTIEIETDEAAMLVNQVVEGAKFGSFLLRRFGPLGLYRRMKEADEAEVPLPKTGTEPLDRRRTNPYRISPRAKRLLREEILPYWKGKAVADLLPEKFSEAGLYSGDMGELMKALPKSTSREATIICSGAALGTWQGHLIPDFETPLRKGVAGMLADVRVEMRNESLTKDENDFLRSIEISLEGVIVYARRLAETIKRKLDAEKDPERREILAAMHANCSRVPEHPPESFYQAAQSFWTVKSAVQLAMPFNVHAPGRLDQLFRPFYEKDIAAGSITREFAQELCEELFLKVMAHNMRPYSNFTGDYNQRFEGSEPVTMGGLDAEGNDATCDLTYVMLDAAAASRASINFVVRFHKNSPDELYMKVAELHHGGASSISVMNDEITMKALVKQGFSQEDARTYAITGCVDAIAPGKTGGEGFSSLHLCRVLDITLRNGDSKTLLGLVKNAGPKTGDPDTFDSFDQLVDAFTAQAENMIEKIVKAAYVRDFLYAERLPAPLISAFMQGCLEKKKDITLGGAVYDIEGVLVMSSIANTVDSLYVIKKLVYEQKKYMVKQILDATDRNFRGYEDLHREIMAVEDKWGNGAPESDALAREITTRIFEALRGHKTFRGGVYAPFINSMTAHTIDGRMSIATPDGRRAAAPFAASCNPYNVEKCGPTGVLRSVAALDFSYVLGCAVNIRMHPSALGKTEDTRRKWASLLKTYFQLGGEQLQPTVVSTETLLAAQKDPDTYRDVIVKVGGYSAYFTDLGVEIQNEIISRTEHTM